ncbi:hypothetical protein K2173_019897 [Erythroxylum novogranatense]|uniref:Oleosin n=1 Tax=Erythroxylum novogranatense TaxID=1862640 RepID=A0AAV8U9C1_9ROSI|nr:hypothetical protein K2173_019897 [Erythroxylum novogranatense]
MADRSPPHQVQVHPHHRFEAGFKGGPLPPPQRGPSASKVLAVVIMLSVGGGLLALAGITLVGTLIGLAIATPLFLLFSPILVPAALVLAFAVTSFLTSGAFGLTGLTSLSWVLNYILLARQTVPEQLDLAKKRMQDMAGFVGQKTKEVGQEIQRKAQHEGKRKGWGLGLCSSCLFLCRVELVCAVRDSVYSTSLLLTFRSSSFAMRRRFVRTFINSVL